MINQQALSPLQALTAGNATVTLSNDKRHFTFKFKRAKAKPLAPYSDHRGRFFGSHGLSFGAPLPPPIFVSVKSGHTMDYAGIVSSDRFGNTTIKRTAKSRVDINDVQFRALNWMIDQLQRGGEAALSKHGFRLQWSNCCVKCGRKLTQPSSIDSRIGPECAKHFSF